MNIIGINQSGHISSACLLQDGRIVAAGAEERFNREKRSREFPMQTIAFLLKKAGLTAKDIDSYAIGWNPGINISKFSKANSGPLARHRGEYLYSVPSNLLKLYPHNVPDHVAQTFHLPDATCTIQYVTHHDAHAALAFFGSGFSEAACLIVDGFGERAATSFKSCAGNTFSTLQQFDFPHSLGSFYGTLTTFLGFRADADEWKVMALASSSPEATEFDRLLKKTYTLLPNGGVEFDLTYFDYYNFERDGYYTSKFVALLGPDRKPDAPLTQVHFDIAGAMQRCAEEIIFHALNHLHRQTQLEDLCVGGGVFMNSVLNGRILTNTPFKRLHISYAPDDSGSSVGSALFAHHCLNNQPNPGIQTRQCSFGPSFADQEIQAVLDKYRIAYTTLDDVPAQTAALLAAGKIIGWFQGGMEFGQRALGHRSILADPRDPQMKDKVNATIKYREEFRPFAPSILADHVEEYFLTDGAPEVSFMEKVFLIRPEKRALIPAVTHIDGTGRLQSVSEEANPLYHKLISAFQALTGIPVVLNTSFNIKGEPIVCRPDDAIRTFFTSGLDCLVIGSFLVSK